MGIEGARCSTKSPNQLTGTPGNTGRKLPNIPTIIKTAPIIIKRRSITVLFPAKISIKSRIEELIFAPRLYWNAQISKRNLQPVAFLIALKDKL